MNDKFSTVIVGSGSYVPDNILTNDDLAKTIDTSHEWIVERTGILQRHFVSKGQLTSDLATQAALNALQNANLKANDIDIIIVATSSSDFVFPSCATRVQEKIGNTNGFAFDVSAACAGFLVGLDTAYCMLQARTKKRALVIGAEVISKLLDMKDRSTCVLFGDGAGAVILENQPIDPLDRGIIDIDLYSDGSLCDILKTTGGIGATGDSGKITMQGREVFKQAVTKLHQAAKTILDNNSLTQENLDWFIPHQANLRIIEYLCEKMGLDMQKVIVTLDKHANTSAASIPLALDKAVRDGKIKQGDLLLLEAIGGGLVWGAALLKF